MLNIDEIAKTEMWNNFVHSMCVCVRCLESAKCVVVFDEIDLKLTFKLRSIESKLNSLFPSFIL